MPRTPRDDRTASRGRRRNARPGPVGQRVVDQITQLVTTNEDLQRANKDLTIENDRLRAELSEIGDALGRLTGDQRQRRGRRAAEAPAEARPRQKRRPITDPAVLEKRRQALAKARAARAERLAAARAAGNGASEPGAVESVAD